MSAIAAPHTHEQPAQGAAFNLFQLGDTATLQQNILQPTLDYLGISCQHTGQLLLGTLLCTARLPEAKRVELAIGPYGISPRLHTRLWDEYLARQPDLASRIRGLASQHCFLRDPHAELGYNLAYATAIAWLVYQHQQLRLPEHCDPASLARIWEPSYPHRGGQASDFLQAWRQAFRQRCKARN